MLPVWLQVQKKRSLMTTQNRVFFTTQMNAVELKHQGQGYSCNDVIGHFVSILSNCFHTHSDLLVQFRH